MLENSDLNGYSDRQKSIELGEIQIVKKQVFDTLYHHILPADKRRSQKFNLEMLRKRNGILLDLKNKNNLLYEGNHWAISTTLGPYSNHHVMIVYIGESEKVSHIGQNNPDEKAEYYSLLNKLTNGLEKEYNTSIVSGKLELYFGLNNSLYPGGGRVQSLFRPHTHVVLLDTQPKEEGEHIIKKVELQNNGKSNKGMFGLNIQNMLLLKNFERNFSDINLNKYNESLIVTSDEYYGIDYKLPGDFSNIETIKIFESVHNEGRKFIEDLGSNNKNVILNETFDSIGNEFDKLGFSIGFYKNNGTWYLRFRFSFRNEGENAGVPELMGHSVQRDDTLGSGLPDMSDIRGYVKNIFLN